MGQMLDVVLYGASDDPRDDGVYPIQGAVANGRLQLYMSLSSASGISPSTFYYGDTHAYNVAPGAGETDNTFGFTALDGTDENLSRLWVMDGVTYWVDEGGITGTLPMLAVEDMTTNEVLMRIQLDRAGTIPCSRSVPAGHKVQCTLRNGSSAGFDYTGTVRVEVWGHYV